MLLLVLSIPFALLVAAVAIRRRLTRRRVIVALVVLVLTIAGGLTWAVATGTMRSVTLGKQIKEGMTISEMEAILGPPSEKLQSGTHIWYFHDGGVVAAFDSDKQCRNVQSIPVAMTDRPRYWFALLTGW